MTSVPLCPKQLPAELAGYIEQFGKSWAASSIRARPSTHVAIAWTQLIETWLNDKSLPLVVRKQSNNRGTSIQHSTGRELIPTDNSPAHWAFSLALKQQCLTHAELQQLWTNDKIPIAMIQTGVEKPIAKYRCTLGREQDVNTYGWKLAHVRAIGLKTRTPLQALPILTIEEHFRKFMLPSNMFVIPLAWSGLGEIQSVIQAVSNAESESAYA